MADDLTQGLGIGDDELQRQRRIYGQIGPSDSAVGPVTPPQAPNIPGPSANDKTPPLTLRGISPAPNIQQRTSADEAEAKRIQDTGSGISQIQHGSKEGGIGIAKPHPILGGFLRGLDVVGSAIAPGVMANIPGTELHHEQLGQGARARIGSDVEEQGKEATAAHTQAETAAIPAQTAHVNAETNALQHPEAKPKEEKWGELPGYTDTDGTPLLHEENSGQVVRASDKKPPTGFKAAKPANDKPDSPEQQFIDSETSRGIPLAKAIHDYAVASQHPEQPQRPQQELAIDPSGKVMELRPGMTVPQGTKRAAEYGKVNADEGKRAEMAENLNHNLDQLEEIVNRRPDLFGPLAGRLTEGKAWLGSNDPDIGALGNIKDNLGMVQQSTHGMRNAQGVERAANSILNSFKNGPTAILAASKNARESASTFTKDVENDRAGNPVGTQAGGGELKPPKAADQGMKWQHRTTNGQTEWRQVPQ